MARVWLDSCQLYLQDVLIIFELARPFLGLQILGNYRHWLYREDGSLISRCG